MADAKKGMARIPVPPKVPKTSEPESGRDARPQAGSDSDSRRVQMLMSQTASARRDSLVVPLVGLLLAFSVISLIVQMLIAFG